MISYSEIFEFLSSFSGAIVMPATGSIHAIRDQKHETTGRNWLMINTKLSDCAHVCTFTYVIEEIKSRRGFLWFRETDSISRNGLTTRVVAWMHRTRHLSIFVYRLL